MRPLATEWLQSKVNLLVANELIVAGKGLATASVLTAEPSVCHPIVQIDLNTGSGRMITSHFGTLELTNQVVHVHVLRQRGVTAKVSLTLATRPSGLVCMIVPNVIAKSNTTQTKMII